jgi:hypothetical protein
MSKTTVARMNSKSFIEKQRNLGAFVLIREILFAGVKKYPR